MTKQLIQYMPPLTLTDHLIALMRRLQDCGLAADAMLDVAEAFTAAVAAAPCPHRHRGATAAKAAPPAPQPKRKAGRPRKAKLVAGEVLPANGGGASSSAD